MSKWLKMSFVVMAALCVVFSLKEVEGEEAEPNLVAYWNFDEGEGNVAKDSSGNEHDGKIVGATWTDGKTGKCLRFDGDDLVSIPVTPALKISQAITMEAWIYPESIEGWQRIIGKSHWIYWSLRDGKPRVTIGLRSKTSLKDYSGYTALYPDKLKPKNWYHYAITYDTFKGSFRLYINGKATAASSSVFIPEGEFRQPLYTLHYPDEGYLNIGCTAWNAGSDTDGDCYFKGLIDEVRIYNRALSEDEIKVHAGVKVSPLALLDVSIPESTQLGKYILKTEVENKDDKPIECIATTNVAFTYNRWKAPKLSTLETRIQIPAGVSEISLPYKIQERGRNRLKIEFSDLKTKETYLESKNYNLPTIPQLLMLDRTILDKEKKLGFKIKLAYQKERVRSIRKIVIEVQKEGDETPLLKMELSPDKRRAFLKIDGFNPSLYKVSASILNLNGDVMEKDSKPFRKAEALNPITFDFRNVCLVSGKPFFPIGLFHVSEPVLKNHLLRDEKELGIKSKYHTVEEMLKDVKAHGFNFIQGSWIPPTREFLDIAKANNLMVMPEGAGGSAGLVSQLCSTIAELGDHPAILSWFTIRDEANAITYPQIKEYYHIFRSQDPYHPVYQTVGGAHLYEHFKDVLDVLAAHNYSGPGALARWTALAVKTGKPVWSVPMGQGNRTDPLRLRCQVYAAIVNGAKGILYYSMFQHAQPEGMPEGRKHQILCDTPLWDYYTELNAELKELTPVILASSSPGKLKVEITQGPKKDTEGRCSIHTLLKTYSGKTYLLAVNPGKEEIKAKFTLSKEIKSLKVLFEKRDITTQKNCFIDDFTPYQVHVYRLE